MIHARSGVPHEIMGLMQRKVVGNSIVIMDSFALPVQGTETRVNVASEANEYMVEYIQGSEKVCTGPFPFQSTLRLRIIRTPSTLIFQAGKLGNAIGWYHSHPGYGCWLAGIDVNTQINNQKFQDPFLAVVVRLFFVVTLSATSFCADRSKSHYFCGKGRYWRIPDVPRKLHPTKRICIGVSFNPVEQDRRLRCPCQSVLPA